MLAEQEPSSLGAHISRRPNLQLRMVWDHSWPYYSTLH